MACKINFFLGAKLLNSKMNLQCIHTSMHVIALHNFFTPFPLKTHTHNAITYILPYRFHPGVVCIARIIDIPLEHRYAVVKELFYFLLCFFPLKLSVEMKRSNCAAEHIHI